jgi:DNA topoisomerase-3
MGRPFAAILRIVEDKENHNYKMEFDFGQEQNSDDNAEPVDLSNKTLVGPCPKCGANVYENGLAYHCEKSLAKPKSCDFRSGRIILQQEILPEQMHKLLTEGRTDLLPSFVSQRTRRPFKAYLIKGKDGKIGFEFEASKTKTGSGDKITPKKSTTRATTKRKTTSKKMF